MPSYRRSLGGSEVAPVEKMRMSLSYSRVVITEGSTSSSERMIEPQSS
jgi:hypothetical protein